MSDSCSFCSFWSVQKMIVNTGAMMLQSQISDIGKKRAKAVRATRNPEPFLRDSALFPIYTLAPLHGENFRSMF